MLRLVGLIYRKEILETLRDRRTLIVMVLLPLALYPLIGVGLTQYVGIRQRAQQERPSTVALRGAPWPQLEATLRRARRLRLGKAVQDKAPVKGARGLAPRPLELLRRGAVDVVVEVSGDTSARLRRRETVTVSIHFDETRDSSRLAHGRVSQAMKALERELLAERLAVEGLGPAFATPLKAADSSISSKRELGSYLLARVLPLLVILMVLLGAFYPAIDLTAGEKERGTLETLLIAPLPRLAVILGKFFVVMTIAIVTGLLNLLSIGVTLGLGFGEALRAANITAAIPWSALAMTLVALVPAAAFFAAIMVAVASLARSFKEAQNLLTPVYLVCMMPAFASQLPGFELDVATALIPAVNVSLLTRDLIAGVARPWPTGLALVSTVGYAFVALSIAARIYNSERLLFASDRPIWRWRRRAEGSTSKASMETTDQTRPPPPQAIEAGLLMLAVMGLVLLVGQPLQAYEFVSGMLVTEWLLIAAPVVLATYLGRHYPRDVLSLRRPPLWTLVGAAMAGLSGWYLVSLYVEHVQQPFLPMPKELLEAMQRSLFQAGRPLALDLLILAISPAICEELLFRGFLLRSSQPTLRAPTMVLLNALLFGIFHLSVYRFVPTAALGAVLTLIALRSGSIFPPMLFHLLNNGVAVVLGRASADGALKRAVEANFLRWLPLALGLFALGLWLALRRGPERGSEPV